MKKLKKVLSLVLVLAMALSVFGVCASATDINDYSDKSEITYTEAVGVLSGLKVLEGSTEDGVSVFKPTKTLSRAEAAAIATRLIGVQDKVVDSTTFTDVEGWAKTYIAIAQSQGLINGRNATTYDPNGTLTGYEWEKIVLCAIGYDAEIEGLVGATWQASTAVLAGKVGLLEGMEDDYKATDYITREQAAQIAYNGLKAYTVIYPTTINKIAKVTDTTLGELVFGLSKKTTTESDIFGAPIAENYTANGEVIYSVAYEAVETYNNIGEETLVSDIIDDLADAAGVKAETVAKTKTEVTTDDTYVNLSIYTDGTASKASVAEEATLGGYGVDVAAYVVNSNGTQTYRIVVKNTYVDVLTKANYTAEKKNSNGKVTAEAKYELGTAEAYLAAEGYEIGDIVVYNVGNESNIGKAPKVVAEVAETNSDKGYVTTVSADIANKSNAKATYKSYIQINEGEKTYFDKNANIVDTIVKKNPAGTAGYYQYIYDTYGNIIYVAKADREKISEVGHVYVFNTISYYSENKTLNTGNLYEKDTDPEAVAQALVVFYEGVNGAAVKAEVINQAIVQTADGKFRYLNEYGEANGEKQTVTKTSENVGQFYEYYKTDDGEYVLKECDNAYKSVATSAAATSLKAATKINVTDEDDTASTVNATEATEITVLGVTYSSEIPSGDFADLTPKQVYEYAKAMTITPTVYTGYSKFVAATGAGYLETDKSGKATVGAIMTNATKTTTTASLVYAAYIGREYDAVAEGYTYNFITSDGETVTYNAAAATEFDVYNKTAVPSAFASAGAAESVFTTNVGTVYKLYLNGDKAIIGYEVASASATVVADGIVNSYLLGTPTTGVATQDRYLYASDFDGYVYDAAEKAAKAIDKLVTLNDDLTIKSQDVVALYTDSDGKVIFAVDLGEATVVTYKHTYTYSEETYAARYQSGTNKAGVDADFQALVTDSGNITGASAADVFTNIATALGAAPTEGVQYEITLTKVTYGSTSAYAVVSATAVVTE